MAPGKIGERSVRDLVDGSAVLADQVAVGACGEVVGGAVPVVGAVDGAQAVKLVEVAVDR
jgi:hypothetical protein